ncbi:Acetate CoA-transferase subunit beta [Serratia fonticola]|uniref:Acetate CoA-transferase subunit beta n=1 Tax=Serratia fonticola TaxID=47917 RepID=A0A4U9TV12_SERFO|nr:Acetate CoA-transferase subunit beta [Serratia fonticola]
MNAKELIARRVALELHDGDIVNLGIGLPTQVVNYLPTDIHITLQSENGFLGFSAGHRGPSQSGQCRWSALRHLAGWRGLRQRIFLCSDPWRPC